MSSQDRCKLNIIKKRPGCHRQVKQAQPLKFCSSQSKRENVYLSGSTILLCHASAAQYMAYIEPLSSYHPVSKPADDGVHHYQTQLLEFAPLSDWSDAKSILPLYQEKGKESR